MSDVRFSGLASVAFPIWFTNYALDRSRKFCKSRSQSTKLTSWIGFLEKLRFGKSPIFDEVDGNKTGCWFGTWLLWLSIYWEIHNPNWRTPWFFRGVGIPPTKKINETLLSKKNCFILSHDIGLWLVDTHPRKPPMNATGERRGDPCHRSLPLGRHRGCWSLSRWQCKKSLGNPMNLFPLKNMVIKQNNYHLSFFSNN